jgi:hypothetical protein
MRIIKGLAGMFIGVCISIIMPFILAYTCYKQDKWPTDEAYVEEAGGICREPLAPPMLTEEDMVLLEEDEDI